MGKNWTGYEKTKLGTTIGVVTAVVLSFTVSYFKTQNFDARSRAGYNDFCGKEDGTHCVLRAEDCINSGGEMVEYQCPSGTVCCFVTPSPTQPISR